MLVERLGGKGIAVTSILQEGSVFSFKIPICRGRGRQLTTYASEELLDIATEGHPAQTSGCGSFIASGQVLIVDDSPFNRLVLRKVLEAHGYSYAEASTGLEAISMIQEAADHQMQFEVVLMDIEMPEMDGITATLELAERVRQGELDRLPPVIGCSAYCTEEDKSNAVAAGMSDYLEKPISRDQLLQVLSRYL